MVIRANALTDHRSMRPVLPRSRRRCHCGCKARATHLGLANGVAMTTGCELSVRRWVKSPINAILASRRNKSKS